MSAAPFERLTAVAAPLLRPNVDTDAIIPSREMRTVGRLGLAGGLFAGWRYLDAQTRLADPEFVLNQSAYAGAAILLSGSNFGCGSSREHAAWALSEYGFRVVVAESFNPIFRGNCVRNGIVPVQAEAEAISGLADWVAQDPQKHRVTVDLQDQTVATGEIQLRFEIDDEAKQMLLFGLDAIDLTMRQAEAIAAFRASYLRRRPWAELAEGNDDVR